MYIQIIFQNDFILRYCSSLIGAKDIHSSKVLHRIQVFDNGLFLRHCNRAFWEIGGYNHRQHFRRETNCNGKSEQKSLHPVTLCKTVNKQHYRHHKHHEADKYPAYGINAFLEACHNLLAGNGLCHRAETSIIAGGKNNAGGRTADNIAAHESQIRKLQWILTVLIHNVVVFFLWLTLAGKGGLTDE